MQKRKPQRSQRGRKKVSYPASELERQPMLMLTCGMTGVGKTYRNLQEIEAYMQDQIATGKKGRKVLIFDVNDHDYERYPTVAPRYISALTRVQARRVRPLTPEGTGMNLEEKRDMVKTMVDTFRNGLLVLEDLDKFMVGAKGQTIIGLLTTNRHSGLDIMISHQSIAKITTTEWENCTWLRLHKQVDEVKRYKNRIPNYFLVRIASFIVDEQFYLANQALAAGTVTKEEHQVRKSFFVYVDIRRLLLQGCSRAAFIRAAKRYIETEEQSFIKNRMLETLPSGQPRFANRQEAIVARIEELLLHFGGRDG